MMELNRNETKSLLRQLRISKAPLNEGLKIWIYVISLSKKPKFLNQ